MLTQWMSNAIINSYTEEAVENAVDSLKTQGFLPENYELPEELDEFPQVIREHAGERLFTFDCECIENDEDYAHLLSELVGHAKLEDRVTEIDSSLDHEAGRAELSCVVDGETRARDWKQDSDWVSSEFFAYLDELLVKNFGRRYVVLPAQDQCAEMILVESETGEAVADAFRRMNGDVGLEQVTSTKITSTLVLSALGFLGTVGGGWYFLGFWKSLALSLVLWLVLCFRGCIKVIREQQEQEALAKEIQENPQLIGELALEIVEEMRKRR